MRNLPRLLRRITRYRNCRFLRLTNHKEDVRINLKILFAKSFPKAVDTAAIELADDDRSSEIYHSIFNILANLWRGHQKCHPMAIVEFSPICHNRSTSNAGSLGRIDRDHDRNEDRYFLTHVSRDPQRRKSLGDR